MSYSKKYFQLLTRVQALRKEGKIIVLVTGVFDLLHEEHKRFLKKAKKVGDVLIVGVESDVRVKQMKGEGRPVNNQFRRLQAVTELNDVDLAFVLPEDFSTPAAHEQLIADLRPHILAVSSHTNHLENKQRILEKYQGKVKIVHQHNPDVSTTQIINHQHSQVGVNN